jgi:hypothetical protein
MTAVVVVGGYGRLGARCVTELVETSDTRVVVAGRNGQRAERLAFAYGARVSGAYVDASDARTLPPVVPGSSCLLICSGPHCLATLEAALEARVPTVVGADLGIDAGGRALLAERAWEARVPLVLDAGAIPGLPGVAAEQLVRTLPEVEQLRVASTGPWRGTEAAARDVARLRAARSLRAVRRPREYRGGAWQRTRLRPIRLASGGPLGGQRLRAAPPGELARFVESHCVERAVYLEPWSGPFGRGLSWTLGEPPEPPFALHAEARAPDGRTATVEIEGEDAAVAAAVSLAALVRAVLAGNAPQGLSTPSEVLNPATHLGTLEKRGLCVRSASGPLGDAGVAPRRRRERQRDGADATT